MNKLSLTFFFFSKPLPTLGSFHSYEHINASRHPLYEEFFFLCLNQSEYENEIARSLFPSCFYACLDGSAGALYAEAFANRVK